MSRSVGCGIAWDPQKPAQVSSNSLQAVTESGQKVYMPPKKKGKKALQESIAKREAAETREMISAYTAPQARCPETEAMAEPSPPSTPVALKR